MTKIKCIAFIFFVATIVRIESRRETFPVTKTYKIKSFDVTPDNNYVEQTGKDSITWKQTISIETKIGVFLNNTAYPIAYLCDENQEQFIQQMFKFILDNDKPCPFEKGLTSNVFRDYKKDTKQRKRLCEPIKYNLSFKAGESEIMSFDVEEISSGEACK